jgi:NAD-dependent dihydropyrimidine dehydrogenase PreA subunit
MTALAPLVVGIDYRCTGCGACLATCPTGALLPAPRRPAVVPERCTGCWECLEVCPAGAISECRR